MSNQQQELTPEQTIAEMLKAGMIRRLLVGWETVNRNTFAATVAEEAGFSVWFEEGEYQIRVSSKEA